MDTLFFKFRRTKLIPIKNITRVKCVYKNVWSKYYTPMGIV